MSDEDVARKTRARVRDVTNRLLALAHAGGDDAAVFADAAWMLETARTAAGKMWVSYKRGELSPRNEFDRMLAAFEGDVP